VAVKPPQRPRKGSPYRRAWLPPGGDWALRERIAEALAAQLDAGTRAALHAWALQNGGPYGARARERRRV